MDLVAIETHRVLNIHMANLELYPQNLGAIDEDSDYTPNTSPSRSPNGNGNGGSFARSAYKTEGPGQWSTPAAAAASSDSNSNHGWSTPVVDHNMTPSSKGSSAKRTFSFSYNDFNDENPDDDLASSAIGNESDFDSDESEEEDLVRGRNWVDPDILYQDEFGYWLVKLLRGSTCGRILKRCVFKIAMVGLVCSIAIFVITYLEARLFSFTRWFQTSPYGTSLQVLMWLSSITVMFMSVMSLLFIKYWASTVTNRKLFIQLLRLYIVLQIGTCIFGVWMLVILYYTFEEVDRWQDDITLAIMFPYYLCTWLFTLPYLIVTLYYTLDITYYMNDLITDVGVIDEPDAPAHRVDLSDVSFNQILLLLVATPVMVVVQMADLFVAIWLMACRYWEARRRLAREREQKRAIAKANYLEEKTKKSSIWTRAVRTAKRRWKKYCGCEKKKTLALVTSLDDVPVSPYAQKPAADVASPYVSHASAAEREVHERSAREKAAEEEEKKLAKLAAATKSRLEAEAVRQREQRETQELAEKAELDRKLADEKKDAAPTLDVPRFKALWASLPTTGSFSAKLRQLPSLAGLTEHMRNQGFHVVFASAPTSAEVEVGICNVRDKPSTPWFMARFVASPTDFSAVMKSEDPDSAARFVKKFSLARVLRIDTTSTASPTRPAQK